MIALQLTAQTLLQSLNWKVMALHLFGH